MSLGHAQAITLTLEDEDFGLGWDSGQTETTLNT